MHPDILGQALLDYLNGDQSAHLLVHASYGETEKMPVGIFFRSSVQFPALEHYALSLCYGSVLDVGAGAGSHSLFLQENKIDVTALDISPLSVEVMQKRGVKKAICADINTYIHASFDTVLLLMNGLGLAQNLSGLPSFLEKIKQLLSPGGQILVDSCDVSYLAETNYQTNQSIGEIIYQFEYKGIKGNPFKWLYVSSGYLTKAALAIGLSCQIIYEEETGQYLARLLPDGSTV